MITIITTIGLFSSILFITDSIDSGWMNYSRQKAGEQDITFYKNNQTVVSVKESQANPYPNPPLINFTNIYNSINSIIPQDSVIYPRIITTNHSDTIFVDHVIATNISLEYQYDIARPISTCLSEGEILDGLTNQCFIRDDFASNYNYTIGDSIFIFLPKFNFEANLTIVGIFSRYTYTDEQIPFVAIDINYFWAQVPEFNEMATQFSLTFLHPENYYHLFEEEKTRTEITKIGGEIVDKLGTGEWFLLYYETYWYFRSLELILILKLTITFMAIGSILFSGIMYYNFLNTSIKDKIHEMGILKSLGAHKSQLFLNLFLIGIILGSLGTIFGITLSYFLMKFFFINLYNIAIGSSIDIIVSFTPQISSVLYSLLLGLFIPITTSSILAFRIYKWNLIEMINPDYIYEGLDNKIKKSPYWKSPLLYFSIGLLWIGFSFLTFYNLPNLFITNQIYNVFEIIPLFYFINLVTGVMILLPFIKYLNKPILKLYEKIQPKLASLVISGLYKHQKRNKSITFLVILLFSNIVATVSLVDIIESQTESKFRLEVGTDISIESINNTLCFDDDLFYEIENLKGVELISYAFSYPSNIDNFIENYYKSIEINYNYTIPKYEIQISDQMVLKQRDVAVYGIDSNYYPVIYQDYIQMEENENYPECFDQLFDLDSNNVIISKEVAEEFELSLYDSIWLDIYQNDELTRMELNVVGIYILLPALFNELSLFEYNNKGGIVLDQNILSKLLDIPFKQLINNILIKTSNSMPIEELYPQIEDLFSIHSKYVYDFNVDGFEDKYSGNNPLFLFIKSIIFSLFFLILCLGLSGFLASAYSTFIERQREIKIFRALGMSIDNIKKMLFSELFLLLTINGILGVIIGFPTAYIYSELTSRFLNNNAKIQEIPSFAFVFLLFLFTYLMLWIMFRSIFKKKINLHVLSNENFKQGRGD